MVRADIAVVADDFVGLVLLQQLVGDDRIARLGAGIDAVIHQRFLFQVEAQALEVLVPVGELDDDVDLGIDLVRRPQHQVGGDFAHLFKAILRPRLVALGGDVGVRLRRIEEEVVHDDFVEVTRRGFHRLLAFGAVLGVFIVESAELAACTAGRQRHTARYLDALGLEFLLDRLRLGIRQKVVVAIDLQIDLVERHLAHGAGELVGEDLGIGQWMGDADGNIDGRLEMFIVSGGRRRGGGLRAETGKGRGQGGGGHQQKRTQCHDLSP